jgi:hypothetical protein
MTTPVRSRTFIDSIRERLTPTTSAPVVAQPRVERIPVLSHFDTAPLHEQIKKNSIAEIVDGISVREIDNAQAVTTPILGQYSGTFGWPDDWGYYWDYLDCVMLVPEVRFSVNLKNRMIWRNDFDVVGKDDKEADRVEDIIREIGLVDAFQGLSWDGLVFGNGYAITADNSIVTWDTDTDNSIAINGSDNITARVKVKTFKPASKGGLYGFKVLDPRTMRVEVDPFTFDNKRHEVQIVKYIQRRYQGPLSMRAPPPSNAISNESFFHRDQVIHLRFNRIMRGLYGYSSFRETYFPLKAYLIMIQFIPLIFYKRADPLLLITFGGEILNELGNRETWWPGTDEEFQKYKNRILNRTPTEDMFADILTHVEEVYKSQGNLKGLEALLQVWRERIMMGLGIPPVLSETRVGSVRWGDLKYETLIDEIREYQAEIERVINTQIIPRFTDDKTVKFRFNKIMPDDWMAMSRAALPIVQFGGANWKWFRKKLGIPEEAAEGAAPMMGLSANPLKGGIGGFTSDPNRMKSPNASSRGGPSKLSKPKAEQP